MKVRFLSPLVALLFLIPGCVGSAAASAVDAMSAAETAAKGWNENAKLAHAMAIEGTFPAMILTAMGESSRDFSQAKGDEAIGDGLAEVWAYRYVAEGAETAYLVVVDRDDTILREETTPLRPEDAALAAWSIDSDDALEKALAANDALASGVARDQYGIVAILHSDEGRAEWLVAGGGADDLGAGGGIVRLDAQSGEIIATYGSFEELAEQYGPYGGPSS